MKSTSDPHIILKMKVIILLTLVPLVSVAADRHTDFDRGAEQIKQYDMPRVNQFQFVCLLYQFSYTEFCIPKYYPSHGIFRIGSDWCFDPEKPGKNLCNINCTKFDDDDLSDDIKCALQIVKTAKLYAWGECGKECIGTVTLGNRKTRIDEDENNDKNNEKLNYYECRTPTKTERYRFPSNNRKMYHIIMK